MSIEVGDYLVTVVHSTRGAIYRVEKVQQGEKIIGTGRGYRSGIPMEFWVDSETNEITLRVTASGSIVKCKHYTEFEFKILLLERVCDV